MSDILVARGKHRTAIIPQTDKGVEWLQDNADNEGVEKALTINSEYVDDYLEALKKAGLEVEVK